MRNYSVVFFYNVCVMILCRFYTTRRCFNIILLSNTSVVELCEFHKLIYSPRNIGQNHSNLITVLTVKQAVFSVMLPEGVRVMFSLIEAA